MHWTATGGGARRRVLEGWTAETLVVGRHTRPAGGVETWGVNTWASDDTGARSPP
jgi:hypothetical protein